MEPRKYQVGDKVRDWQGRVGEVVRVNTIAEGAAPHHRLLMVWNPNADPGYYGQSEGAECNFYPAEFWQVWEGETLRANQSTRASAEHYMRPGRLLVGPGGVNP